jgi:hypothetical protein
MRNLYLALMLMIALPLSVLSQTALTNKAVPQTKPNLPAVTKQIESVNSFSKHDKDLFPKQMGKYKVLDTTIDVVFNSLYDANTPFVYEPKSHTLFVVQTTRGLAAQTDDRMTGFVFLYWSQDGGATWSKETIFGNNLATAKGLVPVNMSLAVLNPNNKTNPADFNYVVFGRLFQYNATTKEYDNKGGFYLLSDGTGGFDTFEQYPEEGPLTNNPGTNQIWSGAKMISTEAGGSPYIYAYGTLSPKPNQQYGMYGFGYIGMEGGAVSDLGSVIPNVWGPQNWRSTGDFNSSYNGPMYMDVDEEGTLYAAVNNIFADDQENRVVAISKSTDKGATWSAFDRMPASVITNYLSMYGFENAFQPKAYNTSGFAVTGKDKFSFVCTFRNVISVDAGTFNDMFVEIYKENGAWQIRQISYNSGDKWRTPWFLADTTG